MSQFSTTARNAMADAYETHVGTAPTLEIRSGAAPANCGSADSGTLLCSITLPSDWLTAASAGAKAKNGAWSGTGAAAGTAGHYRIKQGATCHEQGSVTASGGGGDMIVSNTSIAIAQPVTVNSYDFTMNGG